jgi:hypothetical protein
MAKTRRQTKFRVVIPQPTYRVVGFQQEDLPGIAVVNEKLAAFEPKIVFAWHLSVMLQLEDLALFGMPTQQERELLDAFGTILDAAFCGDDREKPNALFLARITWNETRELIYRVYNPEPINDHLVDLIETETHARPFDYRIDHDPEWKLAEWSLTAGM